MVKPRTKTHLVWDEFKLSKDNKSAKCNRCGRVLLYSSKSGPKNLVLHLKTKQCKGGDLLKSKTRHRRSRKSKSRRSKSKRSKSRRSRKSKSRKSRRMRSRTVRAYMNKSSPIWKMFTLARNNTRAICKNCGKILVKSKDGPSNLIKHLQTRACINA